MFTLIIASVLTFFLSNIYFVRIHLSEHMNILAYTVSLGCIFFMVISWNREVYLAPINYDRKKYELDGYLNIYEYISLLTIIYFSISFVISVYNYFLNIHFIFTSMIYILNIAGWLSLLLVWIITKNYLKNDF